MVRHYLIKGRVQGVGFRWYVHARRRRWACAAGCATRRAATWKWWLLANRSDLPAATPVLAEARAEVVSIDIEQRDSIPAEAETLGPFQIEGAW